MNPFWIAITALAILAAIVNLVIAITRRAEPKVLGVRALAALVSLVAAVGIIVGKEAELVPFILTLPVKLTAAGVFVFAVMFLPSMLSRSAAESAPSLQERAARPANATVRLRERGGDEWVN